MGLADHTGMDSSMGLVDRVTDRGSIALLDGLVVGLVSQGERQKGGDANKGLQVS